MHISCCIFSSVMTPIGSKRYYVSYFLNPALMLTHDVSFGEMLYKVIIVVSTVEYYNASLSSLLSWEYGIFFKSHCLLVQMFSVKVKLLNGLQPQVYF